MLLTATNIGFTKIPCITRYQHLTKLNCLRVYIPLQRGIFISTSNFLCLSIRPIFPLHSFCFRRCRIYLRQRQIYIRQRREYTRQCRKQITLASNWRCIHIQLEIHPYALLVNCRYYRTFVLSKKNK